MSQPSSIDSSLSRRGMLRASAAASAAAVFASVGQNFAYAAAADKIRVGLIGCGGRGKGAAANCVDAAPNVQLVALADLFPDELDKAKATFAPRPKDKYDVKNEQCFSGWDAYQKLLASDVNLVILATPPAFRPMMIEAAISAGKHVFAEKPCCVDPAGYRTVVAAAEKATAKNLAIVSGTQRRHEPKYIEGIKRIHDGMIGELVSARGYWMQGPGRDASSRKPEWSDMEYQLRNWPYYTWLAGDHIVEQHMHQLDIMNWVFGTPPRYCLGTGGRMARTDPIYGHIYDFFSIEYEYRREELKVQSTCRQMEGADGRIAEVIVGTKGRAMLDGGKILDHTGKVLWKYETDEDANINPYELEHKDMVESIRAGKPLNEGKQTAESALTAIMGRMSAYTGKKVLWPFATKSKLDLMPKKLEFGSMPFPAVAIPGKEPLI